MAWLSEQAVEGSSVHHGKVERGFFYRLLLVRRLSDILLGLRHNG